MVGGLSEKWKRHVMLGQVVICGEKGKDLPNSETQRLIQNITLKLEKFNATSQRFGYRLETCCLRAMKHSNGSYMKRLFSSFTWKIARV